MIKIILTVLIALVTTININAQQTKVEKQENVVYGMISGMALLMDIYEPENGNNLGIIFINGSAYGYWNAYQKVYNQVPLKDDYFKDPNYGGKWAQDLVLRGYTVFVINHRFAPRFRHSEIFEDCRRAVRFVRYNAKKYKIDPDNIGAMGHSSGGSLSCLLGVYDLPFVNVDKNPIDSVSSRVQAVVALAAPQILSDFNSKGDSLSDWNLNTKILLNLFGELPTVKKGEFEFTGKFAEGSPITYVSNDDSPILIYHSEDDPLIPIRQARKMNNALLEAGVDSKLVVSQSSKHSPIPDMAEVDNWFKKYLKKD